MLDITNSYFLFKMKQIPNASIKYGHNYCDFSEFWSEKVCGSTSSQVFPYNIFMFSKN